MQLNPLFCRPLCFCSGRGRRTRSDPLRAVSLIAIVPTSLRFAIRVASNISIQKQNEKDKTSIKTFYPRKFASLYVLLKTWIFSFQLNKNVFNLDVGFILYFFSTKRNFIYVFARIIF